MNYGEGGNRMRPILAVDKNLKLHNAHAAEWAKCGFSMERVDTIHEAITRLMRVEKFSFVSINEESVPDFYESIRIMRDIANCPIFVTTSAYTTRGFLH